jgi:hypothetical protein
MLCTRQRAADKEGGLMALGKATASGVFVADDFRDNLIVDRYDNVFATMRGEKINQLRSENSEDVLTWNVFRSLQKIRPSWWLPGFFNLAFHTELPAQLKAVTLDLWSTLAPPPALRLFQKDEGDSEIDVRIETERFVCFIEAKYKSDISLRTKNNPDRDQIIRNLDLGTWYAGVRDFYFVLLVMGETHSADGLKTLEYYATGRDTILARLPHRNDELQNLKGIGHVMWRHMTEILRKCETQAEHEDEKQTARRAAEWLAAKCCPDGLGL